jgi:hypothetical protein
LLLNVVNPDNVTGPVLVLIVLTPVPATEIARENVPLIPMASVASALELPSTIVPAPPKHDVLVVPLHVPEATTRLPVNVLTPVKVVVPGPPVVTDEVGVAMIEFTVMFPPTGTVVLNAPVNEMLLVERMIAPVVTATRDTEPVPVIPPCKVTWPVLLLVIGDTVAFVAADMVVAPAVSNVSAPVCANAVVVIENNPVLVLENVTAPVPAVPPLIVTVVPVPALTCASVPLLLRVTRPL